MCHVLITYKVSRNHVQRFKMTCAEKLHTTTFNLNGLLSSKGQKFKDRKESDFPKIMLNGFRDALTDIKMTDRRVKTRSPQLDAWHIITYL